MSSRNLNNHPPCAPADLHEIYLRALGEKVRAARARLPRELEEWEWLREMRRIEGYSNPD